MRTTLEVRAVALVVAVSAALSGCSEPVVPAPVVTLTAVAATNGQTAIVGSSLARPLTVLVETDGAPTAGVVVSWQAAVGTLGRTSSVTGADGTTTSAWTLGADTGTQRATARVAAVEGASVGFTARALPRVPYPIDSPRFPALLVVTPSELQVRPGQSIQFSATLESEDGTPIDGQPATWESLDSAIATVTSLGLVTGVGPGATTIIARWSTLEGSARISVVGPVASVTVIPSPAAIAAGDVTFWYAEARDAFGSLIPPGTTIWSSGNPRVAFVDLQGQIIGLRPGTAEIIATMDGIAGRALLTVVPPPEIAGSWSMDEKLSMDGYFPCEASGPVNFVRAESGPEFSGTYFRAGSCAQYQSEPLDIGGVVALTGTTQGSSIRFETATIYHCFYEGTVIGEPADTIRGHVGCHGLLGTPQYGQEYFGQFTLTK
ncbi:MAG TPA: Ig-like domain-containing protein [Gemmatimonadales bacterium]|jgi:hypothetical protein